MQQLITRVIDTETTSIEGSVVEIASVDIVNGVICNPMSDFVKPLEAISFEAMAIHHITEAMVANAPAIEDVIGKYQGANVLVAHNAAFDKGKLPQLDAPWICTLKLARHLLPELPSHGNQYLRYALGVDCWVPEGLHAHRALYDCYVTAALLIHLNREAKLSLGQMRGITNEPSLLHRIKFGKHKGKTFAELAKSDPSYLRWLAGDSEDEDILHTIKHHMGAK